MCDDAAATMVDLAAKGVEFTIPVAEERWGLRTTAASRWRQLGLYEPRHPVAI
ncbi:hypothetical protein [Micromonospora sp. NPDC002717]|uniref:hypothetical protein n=1 Tax=Micromonospora sp. NPDC002717 TaxID=3154424 RepID=UPI0033200BF6